MPESNAILLVGHCGPDAFALRSALGSAIPDHPIEMINSNESLIAALPSAALLLINRVLDGEFPTDRGLDLIDQHASSIPTMLISNFEDAQSQAVAAGAMPGFGKSAMYADETRHRLRAAVSRPRSRT